MAILIVKIMMKHRILGYPINYLGCCRRSSSTLDRVQDKSKEELKMEPAVFVRAQCAKSDTMRHIVVQMGFEGMQMFALWVFWVSFWWWTSATNTISKV